jgi:RNA polymerase sigma-70 factor, ECF subfamily
MSNDERSVSDARSAVIELYERGLPDVYGYLVRRCINTATAEDLTAETFLAAAKAMNQGATELNIPWLIGTARHKLIDHWRRDTRQREALEELWDASVEVDDSNEPIETMHVQHVLAELPPHHRAALTLRYMDGLPVPAVAAHLERSVHATESLLVRAKAS